MNWIKVSDRLPEEANILRILTFGYDDEFVAYYEGKCFYDMQSKGRNGEDMLDITEYVTHYALLEPPKD